MSSASSPNHISCNNHYPRINYRYIKYKILCLEITDHADLLQLTGFEKVSPPKFPVVIASLHG